MPDATDSHPTLGHTTRKDTQDGVLHTEKARYLDVFPDVEQLKVAPMTTDFTPQLGLFVLLSPIVKTKENLSENRQQIVK